MSRIAVLGRVRPVRNRYLVVFGVVTALVLSVGANLVKAPHADAAPVKTTSPPTVSSATLSQGWALKSATSVTDPGSTISQVGYSTSGWYPITLPSTVLGGLVANNVYQDIYVGTNLQNVPDLTTQNWWFRGQFNAAASNPGQAYWLRFKGISYRAQIWLNGTLLDSNAVGTEVVHEYNVSGIIKPGAANALAIYVTPPQHNCDDLSFCTVDWNPEPPDMFAGMWGETSLETTGPVALRDPVVNSVLPLPATNTADLTIYADAINATSAPVSTTVSATISGSGKTSFTVSQNVTLNAGERREISFDSKTYPSLHLSSPSLWWPYQFGTPFLYHLNMTAAVSGVPSDTKAIDFGVRQFTDYRTTVQGTSFVGYKVNGVPIMFRGGGYVWDMTQNESHQANLNVVNYTRQMGLNIIRLEGTLGNEDLYNIADQQGVMIMAGQVCCSAWENESHWTAEQTAVANASQDSQMREARSHASMMVWAYGSDKLPIASVLASYKQIAANDHWQNPTLDNVATWSNANAGVKMDGPYKWEPPVLWWDTTQLGSAFGTTAEEGTESPPALESLQRFIGSSDLWPISTVWGWHAGKPKSVFDNIDQYSTGLANRYGAATGVQDFSNKSELMNYENTRAFFEAWNSHEYTQSFGTIFWMLNSAWPSVHWNLYDFYNVPGGGYFGTKKADEPLHIAYDYSGQNVYVVNSTLASQSGMTATATLYNVPDLSVKYTTSVPVTATANSSQLAFTLPTVSGLSPTYFIRLQLKNSAGTVVSNNLYWYSTTPDTLKNSHNWYSTGVGNSADLTGLNTLPANSNVTATTSHTVSGTSETVTISLSNASSTNIAFFLRPEITAGSSGNEVTPIDYSDNYVSLFPGESTTITATFNTADLGGQTPYLKLRGYNVATSTAPVS